VLSALCLSVAAAADIQVRLGFRELPSPPSVLLMVVAVVVMTAPGLRPLLMRFFLILLATGTPLHDLETIAQAHYKQRPPQANHSAGQSAARQEQS
jgi:hypothetical protein